MTTIPVCPAQRWPYGGAMLLDADPIEHVGLVAASIMHGYSDPGSMVRMAIEAVTWELGKDPGFDPIGHEGREGAARVAVAQYFMGRVMDPETCLGHVYTELRSRHSDVSNPDHAARGEVAKMILHDIEPWDVTGGGIRPPYRPWIPWPAKS